MKLIHTIIYVFLLVIACRAQNNLIHNPSFEDGDEGYGTSPCKISQVENMQVWEDDHQFIWTDPLSPCTHYLWCSETDCQPCQAPHSPDWLYAEDNLTTTTSHHAVATYVVPPNNGATFGTTYKIQARTGKGYVGMFPGELIEQKFFSSNPLVGGKKYTFSMYVQISRPDFARWQYSPALNMPLTNVLSGFNDDSELTMSVYLGKNKIKYQQLPIVCDNTGEVKATVYDNFKTLTTNSIVSLKSFSLNSSTYPYLQWHRLTFEFICPSNISYDYIAIEQNKNNETLSNNGYILIDDVSLIESCELNCSPTSGIPNPIIGIPTNGYNASLQVSNVQNVEKLKMEIFPITGQQSIFTVNFNYTNGITGNIYWNGELGAGGTAAIGTYICKLTCENDCGLYDFSQQFVNVGASAPYGPNRSLTKIEPKEINPCCVIDYTLQDRTFNSAKNFQVKEHIFVNGNVHSVASGNLELVAGKSIEVINEFEASPTSLFSAKIVECADAHRLSNTTLTDRDFTFYEKNDEDKIAIPSFKKDLITVLPNPSNGCFNIKTVDKSEKTVCVINSLGLIVYSSKFSSEIFDINLNLPSGIYFIEVISKGIKSQQKIIIED